MQEQPDHLETLQSLRGEIDHIDEQIIVLIAKRFKATAQVGKLKAEHRLEPVDLQREEAQRQRYGRLASENGVHEETINRVFRVLIETVVSHHVAVAQAGIKSSDC
jgi:chorismate mutase